MNLNLTQCHPHASAPAHHARILIAEDSESNVMLFSLFFKDAAYDLDFATNGKEAVEKFKSGSYALVLMDMRMPVMDGWEATRTIRAFETKKRLPSTPIVAGHGQHLCRRQTAIPRRRMHRFPPQTSRQATLLNCVKRLIRPR